MHACADGNTGSEQEQEQGAPRTQLRALHRHLRLTSAVPPTRRLVAPTAHVAQRTPAGVVVVSINLLSSLIKFFLLDEAKLFISFEMKCLSTVSLSFFFYGGMCMVWESIWVYKRSHAGSPTGGTGW